MARLVDETKADNLFESKSLSAELDAIKRNCSYMTRILAKKNVTSWKQLSFLMHLEAMYDCSSVSSKSVFAQCICWLVRVIEELKHDEPSWLLSIRLDRFIDRDVSR
jgi:hypothetical protein